MTSVARTCSVDGCNAKHYAKGYCNPHYQRHLTGAELDIPLRRVDPERGCKVANCHRPHGQNGYCQAHNKRVRSGKPLEPPIQRRGQVFVCRVSGCSSKHMSRGMCAKHDRACRNFNLTTVQYQLIQDSGCQICGDNSGVTLHIDHDHECCAGNGQSCGKCVRGGLCPNCNVGLGMFSDSPQKLVSAIRYLSGNRVE